MSGTAYSLSTEATALAVSGVKLIPGAEPIIISGVTYSLAPKATTLTVDGQTRILLSGADDNGTNPAVYAVDGTPLVPSATPITVSGTTYSLTPETTALVVNGVMLIPGSKPVVASGLTYSLAPKATALSINGETRILSSGAQGSTNTAAYVVDGKPLVPGAKPVIVSGPTYSLSPEATALAVNGVMLIPGPKPVVASELTYSLAPKAAVLSINSETCILSSGAQDSTNPPAYAVDDKPLVPGAKAITVSGITYSLAPKATALTVNDNILIPGGELVVASGISYRLAPQATAIVINRLIKPLAQGGPYGCEIPSLTGYVIGNQTVVLGVPAITISRSSFSLTPKGHFLLDGNNTAIALSTPAPKPGGQISFYLHSNQIVTATATLISDSQNSLVMQNINGGYTTATSIKRDSFTVSATEALNRSSSSINTAILSSSAFTSAAANRRERLLPLGGGPLMISLLAGCMFSRIFGGLGTYDLVQLMMHIV